MKHKQLVFLVPIFPFLGSGNKTFSQTLFTHKTLK